MRILFFDTETNGLPKNKHALLSDLANWPNIVQIAWQLWEYADTTTHIETNSYIIKPDESVVWDNESAAIHGISKERAIAEGVPRKAALDAFAAAAKNADVLCAHNLAFDKPVLKAEYLKEDNTTKFRWWPVTEYCTMENTKHILKLPSKFAKPNDPYKFPKLVELHTYLYGTGHTFDWHNAAGDVECLVSCFHELVRRRLVPLELLGRGERRVRDTVTAAAAAGSK